MSEKGDVQMFYTHVQSEHLRNYPRFFNATAWWSNH